jgi:hypothetical protein
MIKSFLIDGETRFSTVHGKMYDMKGSGAFVKSLVSAANILDADDAVSSVTLESGHVITRA